jgi:DNA-binding response OmpR family regulator
MTRRPIILIADDEAHITYMLTRKLQRQADVLVANNGEEALRLAMENLPSVILSDYQMPGMSGLEMAVKLFENLSTSRIPILMLTARGHRLSNADLARTNIRCLFSKPFSLREVVNRIAELIGDQATRDGQQAIGNDQPPYCLMPHAHSDD